MTHTLLIICILCIVYLTGISVNSFKNGNKVKGFIELIGSIVWCIVLYLKVSVLI